MLRICHRRRRGLTLVEMLTVLFIVSLLVIFVTGLARYGTRAAEVSRARADLQLLAAALERYYLRFGDYPDVDGSVDLDLLLVHRRQVPTGSDSANYYYFSNSLPRGFTALDPWGTSYRYELTKGETDDTPQIYQLYSLGPDRQRDGVATGGRPPDDIYL